MHAIYISKFVFIFFTIKSLLPLERYPLRRRLHNVNFNYGVFFFFFFWAHVAAASCWVAELLLRYLPWLGWTSLIFLSLHFEICHNSLTSLQLRLKLELKSYSPWPTPLPQPWWFHAFPKSSSQSLPGTCEWWSSGKGELKRQPEASSPRQPLITMLSTAPWKCEA